MRRDGGREENCEAKRGIEARVRRRGGEKDKLSPYYILSSSGLVLTLV